MAVSDALMLQNTGIAGVGPAYANEFANNSKIEEKIGLSLAKNGEVPKLAQKITEKSQVKNYAHLGKKGKEKIDKEADNFSGARAFKEEWGTLGGSVFAVMNEIEQDTDTKTEYSTSKTANHPYFPKDKKKPEFDKPLAKMEWGDLPTAVTNFLINPADGLFRIPPIETYNELDSEARLIILKKYRFSSAAAKGTANKLKTDTGTDTGGNANVIIRKALQALQINPDDDNKRKTAIATIKTAMANPTISDDEKAQLGALLDIVVDKHASGQNTNLVKKGQNPENPKEDQWIDDTIAAGKPIISGPSGHTLRYLNFWAEKRDAQNTAETTPGYTGGEHVTAWPSLEAARLVMMANLMPPKHHSYDEIMTSSIGITDKITPVLQYNHKSSYEDLNTQTQADAQGPAQTAYTSTGADAVGSDNGIDSIMGNRLHVDNLKAALLTKLESALKGKSTTDAEALIGTLDRAI